jgi:phospholipid-binding lipoprotein MlaA
MIAAEAIMNNVGSRLSHRMSVWAYEAESLDAIGGIVDPQRWFVGLCWSVGALGFIGCSSLEIPVVPPDTAISRTADSADVAASIVLPDSPILLVAEGSSPPPAPGKKQGAGPRPAAPAPPAADDEFYDPFAREDEGGEEEYDPWEPLNVKIFEFNRQVDKWVLKPVAQGYNFVVPDRLQLGIRNFFYNARFPPRFFNNVFQGKLKGAGIEVGRFLINSTVGLAGFIDVADRIDLTTPEEDTGQTLGFYGVGPGPYLVIPFMQPFTVRDFFGYFADIALNPINWLVLPIIEVEGIPSAVPHPNRNTTTIIQLSTRVGDIINERSLNLEKFQGVEEATLDLYTAVRNAYLQSRRKQIRE